jgi:tRNA dimethylallyltransferase
MFQYVALLGPTASGKTKIAIELAKKYPVEVISVDSVAVYSGLDIGSAKPTVEEMQGVRHHLIDVVDLSETYTVARFVNDANRLIEDIRSRGSVPLLCGGTMMYAHALKQGLTNIPEASSNIRQQLEQQLKSNGIDELYAELIRLDPSAEDQFEKNDRQRILRALSVLKTHGKPLHLLHQASSPVFEGCFILQCIHDRQQHRDVLAKRVDAMIAQGFEGEVRSLLERHGDEICLHPAMRSIGYRQMADMICKRLPSMDVREKIITASAQLVKKQMTWINGFESSYYQCVNKKNVELALEKGIKEVLESME